MRLWMAACALALCVTAHADDASPPPFDYWVLSLSWSPQYCLDNAREIECGRTYSFVVHGLWPEREDSNGAEDCGHVERVDKALVARMLPLMPSDGLIQHEWFRHGSCTGMSASQYFLDIERVHRALVIPGTYEDVPAPLQTTLDDLKRQFMQSNPAMTPESIAAICSGRYLKEVRLCYGQDFQPRACSEHVHDKCGSTVVFRPMR